MEGQLLNLEALMSTLGRRDNRGVADQRVVDTRVGHQVGLELVQINVEGTIEPQGGSDGADNLSDEAVQVLVAGTRDIEVALADVVDGLVVNEESAVRVLDSAVSRQDGVIRLNDSRGHTGGRVDGEFELALLAVLGRETLEEESPETGTSTATEGVEDEETLQGVAVI